VEELSTENAKLRQRVAQLKALGTSEYAESPYKEWSQLLTSVNDRLLKNKLGQVTSQEEKMLKQVTALIQYIINFGSVPIVSITSPSTTKTSITTGSPSPNQLAISKSTNNKNNISNTNMTLPEAITRISQLEKERLKLQDELSSLRFQLEALSRDKKGLSELSKTFETKLAEMKASYREDLDELLAQLSQSVEKRAQLQEEIGKLENKVNELQEAVKKPAVHQKNIQDKLGEELRTVTNLLNQTITEKSELFLKLDEAQESMRRFEECVTSLDKNIPGFLCDVIYVVIVSQRSKSGSNC